VLEAPDGGLINPPSPKVLPVGYAFAAGVPTDIDSSCPQATTTTTLPGVTTTTVATTTTSTTIPANQNLHLTRAKLRPQSSPGSANGMISLQGDFATPPAFTVPPSFSVRVRDSGTLDRAHTFNSCTTSRGRIRCQDRAADGTFKASFKPSRGTTGLRFKIRFQQQAIDGPFVAPLTLFLAHNTAVLRSDTIGACRPAGTGVSCREP